jgi:hypothetical protein
MRTCGGRPIAITPLTSSGKGDLVKLRLLLVAIVVLMLAVACTAAVRAVTAKASTHVVRVADDLDGWIDGGKPGGNSP